MNLWSVEHFFDIFFIKIRFSCNQNIGEGESNFDEKNAKEMFNWSEVHSEIHTTYQIGTLGNKHKLILARQDLVKV